MRISDWSSDVCSSDLTEHPAEGFDENILKLIRGADIVIYDSMYTDEEYACRKGWGHSTWQAGARLCAEAGVKTFVVFHHDPEHDDVFMDKVAAEVDRKSTRLNSSH